MNTLIYKGGNISGYELNIGEKFELVGQYEIPSNGILIKLFHIKSLATGYHAYLTPEEYIKTMGLIS